MTITKKPFVEIDGMVSFSNDNTKGPIRSTFSVSHDDRVGFYKTCAQTDARMVGARPSHFHHSSYTIEFRSAKEEKKFSKLLKRNTDGYLYPFISTKYGLYLVSGLTCFTLGFSGSLVGKQIRKSMYEEKQPAPQVQKITDQKKLSVPDTSRGARTE